MRKVTLTVVLLLALAVSIGVFGAKAATEDDIEQSVSDGVAWLAGEQDPTDHHWGTGDETAKTCLVLVKLEERAYDLGYPSPFDPGYEYSDEIDLGWDYVFDATRTVKQSPLPTQDHTALPGSGIIDDPDTNGNGYGVYFGPSHHTYTTGICLMALAASGTPDRPNDGGLDFNVDGSPDTFKEIAQDAVDWLAFAQADSGPGEGGWGYAALDNTEDKADNSNSGYAVLGLVYGEDFGCTVPAWVRTELNVWIGNIQDPVNGDANDGGSWYYPPGPYGLAWVNELKAGNLIFEMTFYGDAPGAGRFEDALDYIERHWQDGPAVTGPYLTLVGWGYNTSPPSTVPADYQAMYCLMRGLEYSRIVLLDTDGDGNRDDDWFNQEPPASPAQDFASVLVAQQQGDGSWPGNCDFWSDPILCTTWALLTLEKLPIVYYDIGDFVWHDLNADGQQDPGEPGLDGIEVELWEDTDCDGTPDTAIDTTSTADGGIYKFTVRAGCYFVEVFPNQAALAGYDQSPKNVGNDATDSDGDVGTGMSDQVRVGPEDDDDLTIDFGFYQPGTIIVEKQADPDGAPGTFTFTGDAPGTISDDGQIIVAELPPGTYTATEADPTPAFDLTGITCDDGGSATPSTWDVGTRTATFNLESGETVKCTFTNTRRGTIIVEKQTEPDGAPGTFTFTGDAPGTISDDGQIIVAELPPGTYTATEADPTPAFDLTGITCDDGGSATPSTWDVGTRTATFNLESGETVKCTFTNTQRGTIIVEKQTNPDGAPGSFTFTGDASGTISDDGQIIVADLWPGTYTATEADPTPAFDLTGITCDDGGSATPSTWDVGTRTATFNLESGETVKCTFTNTQRGTIIVEKQTNPDGAPGSFTFTGDASGTISDNGQIIVANLQPGTYTATEAEPAAYDLDGITCDDGGSATPSTWDVTARTGTATFNLDPGETVKCTFINTYYPPRPVGVIDVPVNKLKLLAPRIGLASLMVIAAAVLIFKKRKV